MQYSVFNIISLFFTGVHYLFLCEKWLAVEEQDGKVEREFTALEGQLGFGKVQLIYQHSPKINII